MAETDGATSSHSMGFARSSLTVSKNCRVVALETSQDEVPGALVENIILLRLEPEDSIEFKLFLTDGKLLKVGEGIDTRPFALSEFSAHKRSYSYRYFYGTILKVHVSHFSGHLPNRCFH